jgi:hypothetical protein
MSKNHEDSSSDFLNQVLFTERTCYSIVAMFIPYKSLLKGELTELEIIEFETLLKEFDSNQNYELKVNTARQFFIRFDTLFLKINRSRKVLEIFNPILFRVFSVLSISDIFPLNNSKEILFILGLNFKK